MNKPRDCSQCPYSYEIMVPFDEPVWKFDCDHPALDAPRRIPESAVTKPKWCPLNIAK